MKHLLRLFALCVLSISLASAQTVIVKRNVVLRSKPSSSGKNLETLTPLTELKLVSFAMRNGYRHVVTDDGTQGWVWSNNVEVQDQGDTNEETGGDTGLLAKLLAAHSDAVGQPLIENGATVCGPTGNTTGPTYRQQALTCRSVGRPFATFPQIDPQTSPAPQ